MGMMGDVAILGAVVVAGYFIFTNVKGLILGTTPKSPGTIATERRVASRQKMKAEIGKVFGHGSIEQCKQGIGTTLGSVCRCQKYKGVTFIECTTKGLTCLLANCGNMNGEAAGVLKRKELKVDTCDCNFTLDWGSPTTTTTTTTTTPASSSATYYSYMTRPYKGMVPSRTRSGFASAE